MSVGSVHPHSISEDTYTTTHVSRGQWSITSGKWTIASSIDDILPESLIRSILSFFNQRGYLQFCTTCHRFKAFYPLEGHLNFAGEMISTFGQGHRARYTLPMDKLGAFITRHVTSGCKIRSIDFK